VRDIDGAINGRVSELGFCGGGGEEQKTHKNAPRFL
jgi:hypothetical protein